MVTTSPSRTSHFERVPSEMLSPSWGTATSVNMWGPRVAGCKDAAIGRKDATGTECRPNGEQRKEAVAYEATRATPRGSEWVFQQVSWGAASSSHWRFRWRSRVAAETALAPGLPNRTAASRRLAPTATSSSGRTRAPTMRRRRTTRPRTPRRTPRRTRPRTRPRTPRTTRMPTPRSRAGRMAAAMRRSTHPVVPRATSIAAGRARPRASATAGPAVTTARTCRT